MRYFNRFLFFVLACSSVLSARNNQELFLQANQAYDQEEYVRALNMYESIERKSPAILHNMGNCQYQLKRFPDALLCWQRAKKEAPHSLFTAAQHNSDIVRKQLGAVHEQGGVAVVFNFLKYQSARLPLFVWQLLFLCIWFIGIFLGSFFFVKRRFFLFSILSMLTVICAIPLGVKYCMAQEKMGIVKNANTFVFIGPNDRFSAHTTLDQAREIEILHTHDGWHKIRCNNGIGWVPVDTVTVV